jgi:hypothetical protein
MVTSGLWMLHAVSRDAAPTHAAAQSASTPGTAKPALAGGRANRRRFRSERVDPRHIRADDQRVDVVSALVCLY